MNELKLCVERKQEISINDESGRCLNTLPPSEQSGKRVPSCLDEKIQRPS